MTGAVAPVPARRCAWCGTVELRPTQALWCSTRCRQTAWRARRLAELNAEDVNPDPAPKRLCVADPPFPGLARKYYGREETYAGEVDHAELIRSLEADFDGWALATAPRNLRELIPLTPPEARICSWVKPIGVSTRTRGPHNAWEVLIVKPARLRRPGVRDYLVAPPSRAAGKKLMGRKPAAWCMWVFAMLGASHGDTLVDRFPGTGIVGTCWREFVRKSQLAAELLADWEEVAK